MDWLRDLVAPQKTPVKRLSMSKRTSTQKRYHVRNSDAKILTAYKSPTGNGFVYKSKGPGSTVKNVHINSNLYKTRDDAVKKAQRIKKST